MRFAWITILSLLPYKGNGTDAAEGGEASGVGCTSRTGEGQMRVRVGGVPFFEESDSEPSNETENS